MGYSQVAGMRCLASSEPEITGDTDLTAVFHWCVPRMQFLKPDLTVQMAQTFQQLQKQIEDLKAQAEKLRQGEVQEVIQNIRTAIETYGLSEQDLFGSSGRSPAKKQAGGQRRGTGAKYSDGKGNTWVGRGKRPRWLQEALAVGSKLEDFLAKPEEEAAPPAAPVTRQRGKGSSKRSRKAKYRDDAGNVWSGRGPRPRWLKDALAGGKALEDLRS